MAADRLQRGLRWRIGQYAAVDRDIATGPRYRISVGVGPSDFGIRQFAKLPRSGRSPSAAFRLSTGMNVGSNATG